MLLRFASLQQLIRLPLEKCSYSLIEFALFAERRKEWASSLAFACSVLHSGYLPAIGERLTWTSNGDMKTAILQTSVSDSSSVTARIFVRWKMKEHLHMVPDAKSLCVRLLQRHPFLLWMVFFQLPSFPLSQTLHAHLQVTQLFLHPEESGIRVSPKVSKKCSQHQHQYTKSWCNSIHLLTNQTSMKPVPINAGVITGRKPPLANMANYLTYFRNLRVSPDYFRFFRFIVI